MKLARKLCEGKGKPSVGYVFLKRSKHGLFEIHALIDVLKHETIHERGRDIASICRN